MQNFVAIGLRVYAPQIRDFAEPLGWLEFVRFFEFFNKVTAYNPERIFTQNTLNDVVPGKEEPFGGVDDYIFYLEPLNFRKTAILRTDFDWTVFCDRKSL